MHEKLAKDKKSGLMNKSQEKFNRTIISLQKTTLFGSVSLQEMILYGSVLLQKTPIHALILL